MSEVLVRERPSGEARCAYCHDQARGGLVECPACASVVHAECRAALGRCTTLGCSSHALLPAAGPEPFRPRASWFDPRDPQLRAVLRWLATRVAVAAALLALFLHGRQWEPRTLAATLDPAWWGGFGAIVALVAALLAAGEAAEWGVGRRLVAARPGARRFVTLGRAGGVWRLHLRVRAEDVSPAETLDVQGRAGGAPSVEVFPGFPGWLRWLRPNTPMTVHGLDVDGGPIALVDAEGRVHAPRGAPRRVVEVPTKAQPGPEA